MYTSRVPPFVSALSLTCENVNLDLGGGGVVRDASVEAGVGCVGVLHQQIDRGPLRLLGDDLDPINLSILHVLSSKKANLLLYRNSVARSPEGDFFVAMQPLDRVGRFIRVQDDAADVDHAADVHEQVRPSNDVGGGL